MHELTDVLRDRYTTVLRQAEEMATSIESLPSEVLDEEDIHYLRATQETLATMVAAIKSFQSLFSDDVEAEVGMEVNLFLTNIERFIQEWRRFLARALKSQEILS